MIFRPFRAFCQKGHGFSDPGRWPGCVSSPLRGSFAINSARTPGVQQEMWDTLSSWGEGPRPAFSLAGEGGSKISDQVANILETYRNADQVRGDPHLQLDIARH